MKKFLKRSWPSIRPILWMLACVVAARSLIIHGLFWHVVAIAGILTSAGVGLGLHKVSETLGGMYCVDCGTCMVRVKETKPK